jgi:hypothetical protein
MPETPANIEDVLAKVRCIEGLAGCVALYDEPLNRGQARIDGQITTPGPESVVTFSNLYMPAISEVFGEIGGLRIFEIGAGFGHATKGALSLLRPSVYVASEPFVELLPVLRSNMDAWGYAWPRGGAAAYDANHDPDLKPGSVDLILGNSVLHHVLHWERCLGFLQAKLATPGMMLFGEPCRESWIYIISVLRAMIAASILSADAARALRVFTKAIEMRLDRKGEIGFLEKLEDKHLFSISELACFADRNGMALRIFERHGDFRNSLLRKIEKCLSTESDRLAAGNFIESLVPTSVNHCALGDPFMVFAMIRR